MTPCIVSSPAICGRQYVCKRLSARSKATATAIVDRCLNMTMSIKMTSRLQQVTSPSFYNYIPAHINPVSSRRMNETPSLAVSRYPVTA
jgi:hypothetical protein